MQAQAPNAFGLPHGEWFSDLAGWFGGLWPGTSDTVKWHQHSGGLSKGSASKRLTHRLFRAGCCGAFGREHWPWSAAPPFDPGVSRAGKRTEGAVLLRVWLIPFGPGVRLPADLYDPVRSAGGCQTPPATQECGVFWGDAQRWPRSWVWTEAWPTVPTPLAWLLSNSGPIAAMPVENPQHGVPEVTTLNFLRQPSQFRLMALNSGVYVENEHSVA